MEHSYRTIARLEPKVDTEEAIQLRSRFAGESFRIVDRSMQRQGASRQQRRATKRGIAKGLG